MEVKTEYTISRETNWATGKPNDQLRLFLSVFAYRPDLTVEDADRIKDQVTDIIKGYFSWKESKTTVD